MTEKEGRSAESCCWIESIEKERGFWNADSEARCFLNSRQDFSTKLQQHALDLVR
jgi:hypothetical protein